MIPISSGSSTTVALAAGDAIEVSGSGTAQLLGPQPSGRASLPIMLSAFPRDIGPFADAASVLISANDGLARWRYASNGNAVESRYTASQLSALAAAGGLTRYAGYVTSDTGAMSVATSESTLAEIDYDALALAMANGLATYSAAEIDNRAGVPNILDLRTAMATNTWARRFIVDASSSLKPATGKVVAAAVTFAAPWAAPTNPSGNLMRIIQTAPSAHGLGAGSDGKMLYVATSAGVPSGFYMISTRASANQIDVDVGATNQSLIASTVITDVSRAGVYFPAAVVLVPGGIMGPNGSVQFQSMFECNNSAGAKNFSLMVGTTSAGTGGTMVGGETSLTTAYGYNPLAGHVVWNMGATNVQRGMNQAASQTAAPTSHAVDTSADFYALIRMKLAAVDDWCDLLRHRVEVTPGL